MFSQFLLTLKLTNFEEVELEACTISFTSISRLINKSMTFQFKCALFYKTTLIHMHSTIQFEQILSNKNLSLYSTSLIGKLLIIHYLFEKLSIFMGQISVYNLLDFIGSCSYRWCDFTIL